MIRPLASAILLTIVVAAAPAEEVLIAEIGDEFSFFHLGLDIDEVRIFSSIWEEPTGAISNIFNEIFIIETVDESDVGTVFVADLTDPAQASQLARLTNGVGDNIWFGSDSAGATQYEVFPENTLFADQPGPAGLPLRGPDLENYTPTRVELELTALTIDYNGFVTTIIGATTLRVFAQAELSVTVDVGGAMYWGLEGDPDNESRVFDLTTLLGLARHTALEYRAYSADYVLTTFAPSRGDHAYTTFDFDNNGSWEVAFWVALFEPVVNAPIVLSPSFFTVGQPILPAGIITVGFEERLVDDFPGAPDAFIDPGGTVSLIVTPGCNLADRQAPIGILDLGDVNAFVSAFMQQAPAGDLSPPYALFDLQDITVFISNFIAGCPK